MYRIFHNPTGTMITHASDWREAAEALRTHSDLHNHQTNSIVSADPSVILHYNTMGNREYTISRDDCDLMLCNTCGNGMGIITATSDDYPHGKGSWQIACCADCAEKWETDFPAEASDFRSHEIRRIVADALAVPPLWQRGYAISRQDDTITITMSYNTAEDLTTACDIIRDDDTPEGDRPDVVTLCDNLYNDMRNIFHLSDPRNIL
jgi:hypothetical protein